MNAKKIIIVVLAVLILLGDFFGSFYFIAGIKPSDLLNRINPNKVINNLLPNIELHKNNVSETEEAITSDIELISDDLLKNKMIPVINTKKIKIMLKSRDEYSNLTPKIIIKAPDLTNERIYWERDFDLVNVKSQNGNRYEFDISDFYQTGTFLIDLNFYDENGSIIFALLNQAVIFGRRPKISSASIKTLDNKEVAVNVSFEQEHLRPDPAWEIYAVVCNKDQCAFAKKNMAEGWPKELKLDRRIDGRNLTITLIIKAKDLTGYVNSYARN